MNAGTGFWRVRLAIVAACLLLPSASLIPFGAIWLVQHGYAFHWVVAACIFVVLAFLAQVLLLRRLGITSASPKASVLPEDRVASSWTPREAEAWNAVMAVANSAEVGALTQWDTAVALGQQTIEAVAKTLHPEVKQPVWQFTVPEALTMVEQVSSRLKPIIADSIPLGDRLTVAQVLRIYGWRSAIDTVQRGYDIWRLVRMLNPATAATQELRERLSKQMLDWSKQELGKRIAGGFVKEVGRAAIDLYGGRLRVSAEDIEALMARDTAEDTALADDDSAPVRILVCGQINAGKSTLINALAGEIKAAADVLPVDGGFKVFQLQAGSLPAVLMVESPGLQHSDAALNELIEQAQRSDLILWVVSALRADRETDRKALERLRADIAARPNIRPAPMLLVVSQVDKLRPFREWSPPYDLNDLNSAKAVNIKAAVEAAATDLTFPVGDIIPCVFEPGLPAFNADTLLAAILEKMPDAKRARLVRTIRIANASFDWRKLRVQAVNAGRLVAEVFGDHGKPGPRP